MKKEFLDDDITVVLSAYKRIEYLQLQIDAIKNQSLKPKQILLFQDGINGKEKVKIPEKILKQFDLVEISKTNKGVWARFDFARKNVKTKYVCIFDDDTIPGPRWLENCVREMQKQEGLYGTIGILCKTDSYAAESHTRVGWAVPNKKTQKVDFVGHSWFLKTQWLDYMFEGTEELQAYKICGEDMTLSYKLQQHGINTFVPPHPKKDKSLWGSLPQYSTKFGDDNNSLFINNGWSKMTEAFDLLLKKYNFKLVKDIDAKRPVTKRPVYKIIYHLTVKPLLNIITGKKLRDYAKIVARKNSLKKQVLEIEKDFPENTVLIFQHQFFDKQGEVCFNGGAERYVVDLADILTESGYNPVLIQIGDEYADFWKRKVKNLQIIGLSLRYYEYINVIKNFTKYKFVIYSGAVDWGQKIHPNILISHGVTWDVYSENVKPYRIYDIFKDVDTFVSVDTNTISWLRSTFSKTLKDLNSFYVPNYVDTKLYCPKERKTDKKIHITFPRRASPERGYWLMSAALPPILDKYPEVNFQFVGFAHGKEIQDDILYLEQKYRGRVSHCMVNPDEMPAIYQNTDISLIPTLYAEGTSLSCLEAQACGNVVISTNIGGLPDLIIDGYNGLLINPNGQDLMKALDRILADKDLRKKLSENAVSIAKAFDKSIWVERWKKIVNLFKE